MSSAGSSLRFAPNLSLLWSDRPLDERFERASAAGFDAVELWWPGEEDAARLPELTRVHNVELALLNFHAGDMPAGDRGLLSDPRRFEQFRTNVPVALEVAAACGCRRLNALLGLFDPSYTPDEQLELARENVAWAADCASPQGAQVLVEAVNSYENGPYLVTSTAQAAEFVERVARANVGLQYDAYHMQRMEGNVAGTIEGYWDLIRHIQIADSPGRHEPGTGELNYTFILTLLEQKGYDGFVGLEYRPSTGNADDSFGWLQ